MQTKTFYTYEEAVTVYLTKFSGLREGTAVSEKAATRGASVIPTEILVDRADEIAGISSAMMPFALKYLESPNVKEREGISAHLLAQISAELQLSSELLEIVQEGETPQPQILTARSARGANLRQAITNLEGSMKYPVTDGFSPFIRTKRSSAKASGSIEGAKAKLLEAVNTATESISQKVIEFGGGIAVNLVSKTEWSAVLAGSKIIGKDIVKKLESLKKGLGAILAKAVSAVAKILKNVFDKIMALLGKEARDKIRKKIREWLDKIRKEGKIGLFDNLVNKFYSLDPLKKDLPEWLKMTKADADLIGKTTDEVKALGDHFDVLINRMNMISNVVSLAGMIKIPQIIAILTGIQVFLLGYTVYSGYDYIGYKQVRFLNITKGVAEVIREKLLPE